MNAVQDLSETQLHPDVGVLAAPAGSSAARQPAHAAAVPAPGANRPGRRRIFAITAAALVLGAALGGYYWTFVAPYESTDDAFVEADVTPIAPQVAGRVLRVPVSTPRTCGKAPCSSNGSEPLPDSSPGQGRARRGPRQGRPGRRPDLGRPCQGGPGKGERRSRGRGRSSALGPPFLENGKTQFRSSATKSKVFETLNPARTRTWFPAPNSSGRSRQGRSLLEISVS